jgi:hypothetical protein
VVTEGWRHITPATGINWWSYRVTVGARRYEVTVEPRPVYCDRGHWVGKVHGVPDVDGQDAFPRYYMDLSRAKLELADWLEWRLKRSGIT